MTRIAFVLSALVCLGGCCPEPWPQETFTPERWKALPWDEHYTLCNSLLESGILVGATRDQVIELLGPPNGTRKPDRLVYLVRKRKVLYVIGEIKVLDFRFDGDGKVTEAFIRGT